MILIINLGKKIQKLIWTWLQITDLTNSLLNINNFFFQKLITTDFFIAKAIHRNFTYRNSFLLTL